MTGPGKFDSLSLMERETNPTATTYSGSDFGLADPDFWAWFREKSMTPEELAWHNATKALYHSKRQEFYDAAKADIMVGVNKTKTKKFTMTHHRQAISVAKGAFSVWRHRFESETAEYEGVKNPKFGLVDEWAAQDEKVTAEEDDLAAWLAAQTWSEFAVSLAEQYRTKGSLSPRQWESARSMRTKVEARRKEREATKPESGLDLSDLPSGMYAVPGGDTRLKVRISRSKSESRSGRFPAGTIFVNDDAAYGARKLYGSQVPGATYKGDIVEALKAIAANPLEASKAYGLLVGRCGACNARLEDAESIANGIGPICAQKF